MKKMTALLLVLLIAAASAMAVSAARLSENAEAVVYTPAVLSGDESEANDVRLSFSRSWDYRLHWQTDWSASGSETEFRFTQNREYYRDEYAPRGIYMIYNFYIDAMAQAYDELIDKTQPGSTGSAVVRLADYFDYYPFWYSIDLPGWAFELDADNRYWEDAMERPTLEEQLWDALNDFFRIPVHGSETMLIDVEKDSDGNVFTRGGTYNSYFSMDCYSAIVGNDCFFTVRFYENELGELPDLSLIPGGWGVYRLSFDESDIHIDSLENVWPIADGTELMNMTAMGDDRLTLHTVENGKYVLTVIDTESMTQVQRLEVIDFNPDELWSNLAECDGFMVLSLSDCRFVVLAEANGLYEIRMQGDEAVWLEYMSDSSFALSGDRLAVAGGIYTGDVPDSGFMLAVFDSGELVYNGRYSCSLDDISTQDLEPMDDFAFVPVEKIEIG